MKHSNVNKKSNRIIMCLISIVALSIFAFDGIYAYLTDVETQTNVFTLGDVEISLTEPGWDILDDLNSNNIPDVAENIIPNVTITKDPTITNTGSNPAYVFLEIQIPYANVTLKGNSSSVSTELFSYQINNGWNEIGNSEIIGNKVKHVYSYSSGGSISALNISQSTNSLFDEVTFKNIEIPSELNGIDLDIVVTAYGIQTTGITENTQLDIFRLIDPNFNN